MLWQDWGTQLFGSLSHAGGVAYSNYAVGYNNVDVKAATKAGIPVGNTPGGHTAPHGQAQQRLSSACVKPGLWAAHFWVSSCGSECRAPQTLTCGEPRMMCTLTAIAAQLAAVPGALSSLDGPPWRLKCACVLTGPAIAGVLTETTAELAAALTLAAARRVVEADRFMRGGKYEGWLPNLFVGNLLQVRSERRVMLCGPRLIRALLACVRGPADVSLSGSQASLAWRLYAARARHLRAEWSCCTSGLLQMHSQPHTA